MEKRSPQSRKKNESPDDLAFSSATAEVNIFIFKKNFIR
jgi:hypothetical protein